MSTTKLFTLILLALTLLTARLFAVVPPFTSLTLAWDRAPQHTPDIQFELQWGTSTNAASTNFYNNAIGVGTNTVCTVTNPTTGYLYFRSVAVHPASGLKSEPSNVVSETNRPASTLQLRITTNTTSSLRLEGTADALNWIHLATIALTNPMVVIQSASKTLMLRTVQLPPLP